MRAVRKGAFVALTTITAAILPWVILFGVNLAMGQPPHTFDRTRCTRHCHDHGCRHEPALPASLTSNRGLFGDTVRGLHWLGSLTGLGQSRGYALANLVIFCLLWPGAMLVLVGVAAAQRHDIADLRRREQGGSP